MPSPNSAVPFSGMIGVISCTSNDHNTACGRYCGKAYTCSTSHSTNWWGAWPWYKQDCATATGGCTNNTHAPMKELTSCGAYFFAGLCKSKSTVLAIGLRSCGPPPGPPEFTYVVTLPNHHKFQTCSPTGTTEKPQYAAINHGAFASMAPGVRLASIHFYGHVSS